MKRSLAALVAAFAGCSRSAPPPRGPIVVLRFDNLTGDPSLDWMGRGAARVIGAEIEGAILGDSPQPAEDRERAIAAGSTRILRGYIARTADRLRLRADLEDAAAHTFPRSAEASGPISAGLAPLADAVAHQLDPQALPPATRSQTALADYIAALNAVDPNVFVRSLTSAIAADPNFAAPYLTLIEFYQSRQDRDSAGRILAQARVRGEALPAVDRARLDIAAAQISGDPAALAKSLAALALLTPDDPRLLRSLGDSELQAKRYVAAEGYYRKALAAQPGDAVLLNTLGYAQAYAGDLNGAVKTMREYERAHPGDANPLDSLGDVNFYWNRFAEAESFYRQEYRKDPTFLNGGSLIKAATARLFTGDANGAEALFAEYEKARRAANDPLIGFTRDSWDRLRGRRAEAIRNLEAFASSTKARELASLSDSALTIWLLEAGDRARARQYAAQAVANASGSATGALAAACRFIADPSTGRISNPVAQAYAFLLAHDFAGALPLLRQIAAHAAPSPSEEAPVLLAWALVETGHAAEAAPHLRSTPVPNVNGPAPFESLIYPRIFRLRAEVAEKAGDAAGSARLNRLFETLSGQK